MKPLKYENEKYEILIENHVFIKDKIKNNYLLFNGNNSINMI